MQSVVAVMGVTLRASARRRSPSGPLAGHKPFPRERRVIQFNSVMTDAARRLEVFRRAFLQAAMRGLDRFDAIGKVATGCYR
jgi:hypothetical protein